MSAIGPYVATSVKLDGRINPQTERRYLTVRTVERSRGLDRHLTFTVSLKQAQSMYEMIGRALEKALEQEDDS